MQLRNCILIALAFDATEEEIAAAHDMIDRHAGADPSVLVSATVNGTTGQFETTGSGMTPREQQAAANSTELDAAGFPWDERIHSSNKKRNDKGLWWARRGVTPALKAQVEAELRKTISAPAATTTPQQPAASTPAPVSTPPQPAASGPPMPGANLPPMPGAAQPDPAYTALVQFIAQNTKSAANPAGVFDDQYIVNVLAHYGVAEGSLQNLAHRLDLVPTIDAWLRSVIAQQ